MKKAILFIGFFVCLYADAIAQSDGNYDYTKEFIWGINKNTNGGMIGGFVFKWATAIGEKQFQTIGFELMNVKHPKEHRSNTPAGNPVIYGKARYLYAIRGQYGRDFILYNKAPQQGVQIIGSLAVGPTIGIIAPYYVQANGISQPVYLKEDGTLSPSPTSIEGTGHLFEGLGESSIKPGLNLKAGLAFELGAFKSNVTGFEVGVLGEVYAGKVELMPLEGGQAAFVSAYITLFYGTRR